MDWDKLEHDAYAFLTLTPHELYEYTHREYENMMKAYHLKREMQLKDYQYQAWFNANFVASVFGDKGLPKLEEIMKLSVDTNNVEVRPESNMNEDEKYTVYRNKWITIKKMGLVVPQDILDKYNIRY